VTPHVQARKAGPQKSPFSVPRNFGIHSRDGSHGRQTRFFLCCKDVPEPACIGPTSLSTFQSGDPFVLQDSHHYSLVLRLPFRNFVVPHLQVLAHRTRGYQIGKGNVTLTHQKSGDAIGAILADLLIQGYTADRSGLSNHLDVVVFDPLGFSRQFQKLSLIRRIDSDFAVPEMHRYLVEDIVFIQLAKPRRRGRL